MQKKIILASTSPRRAELLQRYLGPKLIIAASSYQEDNTLKMPPQPLAMHHAYEKGLAVSANYPDAVVIAADTFVSFAGQVLGKPLDAADAVTMLHKISGQWVDVLTGVAVFAAPNTAPSLPYLTDCVATRVKIAPLSPERIAAYVASGEPLDKAGAFAIQGLGGAFVAQIDGCYSNVVGLPLPRLDSMLLQVGIDLFGYLEFKAV